MRVRFIKYGIIVLVGWVCLTLVILESISYMIDKFELYQFMELEKEAKKLVSVFYPYDSIQPETVHVFIKAKENTLICIDEKIKTLTDYCTKYNLVGECFYYEVEQLIKLKQEIETL